MAPKKKAAAKRQVWNKGLKVGKRDGFTPDQVRRIRGVLADRGSRGLRDLALFSTAIDTMLQAQDLLKLAVRDVQSRNGAVRSLIKVSRSRSAPVQCALSKVTVRALEKWITGSAKKRTDYLFTGHRQRPIGSRRLNHLVKLWAQDAGLDASKYTVESLRRTKALHILRARATCRRCERCWATRGSRAPPGISASKQSPTPSKCVAPLTSDTGGLTEGRELQADSCDFSTGRSHILHSCHAIRHN